MYCRYKEYFIGDPEQVLDLRCNLAGADLWHIGRTVLWQVSFGTRNIVEYETESGASPCGCVVIVCSEQVAIYELYIEYTRMKGDLFVQDDVDLALEMIPCIGETLKYDFVNFHCVWHVSDTPLADPCRRGPRFRTG